jgi:hypothetical protein
MGAAQHAFPNGPAGRIANTTYRQERVTHRGITLLTKGELPCLNEKGKAGLLLQGLFGVALGLAAANALADGFDIDDAFIPRIINSSTIPANGDVNPYGVAFVPDGFAPGGTITAGDVLAAISTTVPISKVLALRSFNCIPKDPSRTQEWPPRFSRVPFLA